MMVADSLDPYPVSMPSLAPSTAAAPAARRGGRGPFGAYTEARTWLAAMHLAVGLLLGSLFFSLTLAFTITSIALVPVFFVAVPFFTFTFAMTRTFGAIERARLRAFLGIEISSPHRRTSGSWWARWQQRLRASATWREIGYLLLSFPLTAVGFAVVFTLSAGCLALLPLPLYARFLPGHVAHFWLFSVGPGLAAWGAVVAGVVGLIIAPWVALGWAAMDAGLGRRLLGPTEKFVLTARVEELSATRAAAVDGAEAERRRIERDLHDGAQQRLVALAMGLGMAKDKFADDPEAAKALIDDAHIEAKRAVAELRDLARGIHPVALTDRGLEAALPGLADRSPVPVEVDVDLGGSRPSASVEGIAYFVVSECLTNMAKHARATWGSVRARRSGDRLHLVILDDGVGGAFIETGGGLGGLVERVASVDGTLTVDSPTGGPTIISVDLPSRAWS